MFRRTSALVFVFGLLLCERKNRIPNCFVHGELYELQLFLIMFSEVKLNVNTGPRRGLVINTFEFFQTPSEVFPSGYCM